MQLQKDERIISGVNSVLKSFPWQRGDEILATIYTYKAVEYACRKVADMSTGKRLWQGNSTTVYLVISIFMTTEVFDRIEVK
jgi:hypothetical protein